jgi:hypothetical protein
VQTTTPEVRVDAVSVTTTWNADCGEAGLVGSVIGVRGAEANAAGTLLRVHLADGRSLQTILRAGQATYTVPERAARGSIMQQYAGLGVQHILGGFDHLLFVFGLLLLVPAPRALAKTVTAFTAGHSVTLSLAALGYTAFPSRPIEVLIALTVFWLAVELAQPPSRENSKFEILNSKQIRNSDGPTLLRRRPWAMAAVFGLLHGLGFAGALAEIGLPAGEIPAALLAFNAGIESGQLLFIGGVLALSSLARRLPAPAPIAETGAFLAKRASKAFFRSSRVGRVFSAAVSRDRPRVSTVPGAHRIPVYAMGALSAFWLLERVAALLT